MAGISNYLEDEIVDHIFGNGSFTPPATYVALFTTAPDPETGSGGVEVSGGSYARQQVSSWDISSGGATANTNEVAFPTATASWGTVVAAALYDAATAGNMLMSTSLAQSKTINNGDTAKFAAGDIDFSLD